MQAVILLIFLDKESLVLDPTGGHDTCQQLALCIAEFLTQGRCLDGSRADIHIGACVVAHNLESLTGKNRVIVLSLNVVCGSLPPVAG